MNVFVPLTHEWAFVFEVVKMFYRCAKYTSLPAGCTLVADPQDPLCCEVPHCIPHTNTSVPYPVPPLGHKTGGYVTPAPPLKPGASPTPGSTLSPPLKGRQNCLGQGYVAKGGNSVKNALHPFSSRIHSK